MSKYEFVSYEGRVGRPKYDVVLCGGGSGSLLNITCKV